MRWFTWAPWVAPALPLVWRGMSWCSRASTWESWCRWPNDTTGRDMWLCPEANSVREQENRIQSAHCKGTHSSFSFGQRSCIDGGRGVGRAFEVKDVQIISNLWVYMCWQIRHSIQTCGSIPWFILDEGTWTWGCTVSHPHQSALRFLREWSGWIWGKAEGRHRGSFGSG